MLHFCSGSISSPERGLRTNAHMIQDSRQIFKMFARAWTYHNTWRQRPILWQPPANVTSGTAQRPHPCIFTDLWKGTAPVMFDLPLTALTVHHSVTSREDNDCLPKDAHGTERHVESDRWAAGCWDAPATVNVAAIHARAL